MSPKHQNISENPLSPLSFRDITHGENENSLARGKHIQRRVCTHTYLVIITNDNINNK